MIALNKRDNALAWKERLGFADRHPPEYYEAAKDVVDAPHAGAIRTALEALGISAVFCVQDVPTIAILFVDEYEKDKIVELHAALWNQGLASLLLVATGETLRAFSLGRKPLQNPGDEFDRRCLIRVLNATADAIEIRNIVYGTESGRIWKEQSGFFKIKERVDQILLNNLSAAHEMLCLAKLKSNEAQALLMQAMFVSYLEDRKILTPDYFGRASKSKTLTFGELLKSGNLQYFNKLFTQLRDDFNGDLFVAPCSFQPTKIKPALNVAHLDILHRFRMGTEVMGEGQLRFWGYDFRYIPIELISAVYDRFLGENEQTRHDQGAYYTPMFLADTVVTQLWNTIPLETKSSGQLLDPACGSGIFLVRLFQRLCEHWRRTRKSQTIRWDSLIGIIYRIHGWDINEGAVRVAVFSLYVALLEEVTPRDLESLMKRGKVLPALWGKNLIARDFFDDSGDDDLFAGEYVSRQFDVVVGNPPWASRHGLKRSSVKWCSDNKFPMPGNEDSWAFTWKSLKHISEKGIVALLLPAMGFLHNHAETSIDARARLFSAASIKKIINFADLRFQLFDGAVRPTALFIFARKSEPSYKFDYWAPKADSNLQTKRQITLSSADQFTLHSDAIARDPLIFKKRLWMQEPEAKLFSYISRFTTLGSVVSYFKKQSELYQWHIGQGFQPISGNDTRKNSTKSNFVGALPNLPIQAFQRIAQSSVGLVPWKSSYVRRKGFEAGFQGPRILVSRGVETSTNRLKATYVEENLTFRHIIQAIRVPNHDKGKAKLLTALLNSWLISWFVFHGTSSFGSDRPEVQQAELLSIPFPSIEQLPDQDRARIASEKLVKIVEDMSSNSGESFLLTKENAVPLREIDNLSYEYFCLSDNEKTLIEDTMKYIVPAIHPSYSSYRELWHSPSKSEREDYGSSLATNLSKWMKDDCEVSALLEGHNKDIGVLRLQLGPQRQLEKYSETSDSSLDVVLSRLAASIGHSIDTNFQLKPDLRVFISDRLYLIKPMQKRFWLKSAALADAGAIANDLQTAIQTSKYAGSVG